MLFLVLKAHLTTQQLDPRVRYGRNTTKSNGACISTGMDQGFHNWLIYSGDNQARYVVSSI